MSASGSRSTGWNGGKVGSLPRKHMGIQFVKSSEILNDKSDASPKGDTFGESASNSDVSSPARPKDACHKSPFNSNGLLPTPGHSIVDTCHKSAPTSDGLLPTPGVGRNNNLSPLIQFGSPAINFQHASDKPSGNVSARYMSHGFVKSGDAYSSLKTGNSGSGYNQGYRMPGLSKLNRGTGPSKLNRGSESSDSVNFEKRAGATPICSTDQYLKAWKEESDPFVQKIRKLAYEVVTLKTDRPNAKDKLNSAAHRVPISIEFDMEPAGARNNKSFVCYVCIENISVASGQGAKIKDAKTNGYEAALQKILMPHLRIVSTDPTTKALQGSAQPFTSPPQEPSKVPLQNSSANAGSHHRESNIDVANLKRRFNEYKPLDDFVIVEPKIPIPDCTPAHILRGSADFNHMLLEYDYFFKGESARCLLKIENEVLADVKGVSKAAAKNIASAQALLKLKQFCWIIKTKQAVDSNTKISKEEIMNELNEQSNTITDDNIGNKLLRKMGWSGGGVGKDGEGIAEPVEMSSVLNREGLGLSASKGITDDFRRNIQEVIGNYAASTNQEDLVFSCDFRLEERQIIHDECRKFNLRSKSKGKGQKRYLCVRRKRSANELFNHLMSVGGETARYQLVPPGGDNTTVANAMDSSSTSISNHFRSTDNATTGGIGMPPSSFQPSHSLLRHHNNRQGRNQLNTLNSSQVVLNSDNKMPPSHFSDQKLNRFGDGFQINHTNSNKFSQDSQSQDCFGTASMRNNVGHQRSLFQTPGNFNNPIQNNSAINFGSGSSNFSHSQRIMPHGSGSQCQNMLENSVTGGGFQHNGGKINNFSFGSGISCNSNSFNNGRDCDANGGKRSGNMSIQSQHRQSMGQGSNDYCKMNPYRNDMAEGGDADWNGRIGSVGGYGRVVDVGEHGRSGGYGRGVGENDRSGGYGRGVGENDRSGGYGRGVGENDRSGGYGRGVGENDRSGGYGRGVGENDRSGGYGRGVGENDRSGGYGRGVGENDRSGGYGRGVDVGENDRSGGYGRGVGENDRSGGYGRGVGENDRSGGYGRGVDVGENGSGGGNDESVDGYGGGGGYKAPTVTMPDNIGMGWQNNHQGLSPMNNWPQSEQNILSPSGGSNGYNTQGWSCQQPSNQWHMGQVNDNNGAGMMMGGGGGGGYGHNQNEGNYANSDFGGSNVFYGSYTA